jgi:NTE family protein
MSDLRNSVTALDDPLLERRRLRYRNAFAPLAIALGSGSLRGLSHIGVLKVLEELDIRPSLVTGTSMGAIIGSLWAAGMTSVELVSTVRSFTGVDLGGFDVQGDHGLTGLVDGERAFAWLDDYLPATFEQLAHPFACVIADLATGERIVCSEGDVREAVRISASLPVAFEPTYQNGHALVDGGLVEPVPVDAAHELGAKSVIAIPLNKVYRQPIFDDRANAGSREDIDLSAVLQQVSTASINVLGIALAREECGRADVVITPDTTEFGRWDLAQADRIVERGRQAAWNRLDALMPYSHLPTEWFVKQGLLPRLKAAVAPPHRSLQNIFLGS